MKLYTPLFWTLSLFFYSNLVASEMNERPNPKIIPITTQQPENEKRYPIAIIGAGAAGTMAVQRAVLNNNEVLLFTGTREEQRSSRGYWVRKVENIPGFSKYERTVLELRNETLEELSRRPLCNNLYVIEDSIAVVEKDGTGFKLTDKSGRTYHTEYVILATGIMDEQPHVQGSIRPILKYANNQSIAYCLLCDGHRSFQKQTAVIGHSELAAEMTLILSKKYQPSSLSIFTNGHQNEFSAELLKELETQNISIYESPILDFIPDENLKILTGIKLENGEEVPVEIGFVALGIRPNNKLALQIGAQVDDRGLVITDSTGETSVPNFFVIGDLRSHSLKQIYIAWEHAVTAALSISSSILDSK